MDNESTLKSMLEPKKGMKVLAIAPHVDDIELGAGATIMRLIDEYEADVYYCVMTVFVHGAGFQRLAEAEEGAKRLGVRVGGTDSNRKHYFEALHYEDTKFPDKWREIQGEFEELQEEIEPSLVIIPSVNDVHQDHVTVAEAAMRVFRSGESIWHYWIPQFDTPLFSPNFFVDVSGETEWEIGKERDGKIFREGIFRDEQDRIQKWRVEVDLCSRKAEIWWNMRELGLIDDGMTNDDKLLIKKRGAVYHDMDGNSLDGRIIRGVHIVDDIEEVLSWGKKACVKHGKLLRKGSYAERKAELLQGTFLSEAGKKYFDLEIIMGTMSTRGQQCGPGIEYAEGFEARISI